MKQGQWHHDNFSFSRRELKGIYTLVGIWVIVIGLNFVPVKWWSNTPTFTIEELQVLQQATTHPSRNDSESDFAWNLTSFNPNSTKAKQFREMGFDNEFISKFFKYRNAHGYVKTADEFIGLHQFTEHQKQDIHARIHFNWSNNQNTHKDQVFTHPSINSNKSYSIVNINEADSLQLLSLTGIGPVYASRIIRYRTRLGGFHQLRQLEEVYGLDSTIMDNNKDRLTCMGTINKLIINKLDVKALASHPYIDFTLAKRIVAYRRMHGNYVDVASLLKVYGMNQEMLKRLSPYLLFVEH